MYIYLFIYCFIFYIFFRDYDKRNILTKNDGILCASSEGSISVLIPFSSFANFKKALCIEIAITDNISSIGNLSHNAYREYKVNFRSKHCKGIVDGELLKNVFFPYVI